MEVNGSDDFPMELGEFGWGEAAIHFQAKAWFSVLLLAIYGYYVRSRA